MLKQEITIEQTAEGGRVWERAASPRWDEMADGFSGLYSEEGNVCELEWTWFSQNRQLLMAILGWYPAVQGEQINLGTVERAFHAEMHMRRFFILFTSVQDGVAV